MARNSEANTIVSKRPARLRRLGATSGALTCPNAEELFLSLVPDRRDCVAVAFFAGALIGRHPELFDDDDTEAVDPDWVRALARWPQ
jgi:hypothetical protein